MSPKIKQGRAPTEASRSKELAEVRRENKQLKKLVGRLQKTIQRYERERGITLVLEAAEPEPSAAEAMPEPEVQVESQPSGCPSCGGRNLINFTTPGGRTLISCKDCKTRL